MAGRLTNSGIFYRVSMVLFFYLILAFLHLYSALFSFVVKNKSNDDDERIGKSLVSCKGF